MKGARFEIGERPVEHGEVASQKVDVISARIDCPDTLPAFLTYDPSTGDSLAARADFVADFAIREQEHAWDVDQEKENGCTPGEDS